MKYGRCICGAQARILQWDNKNGLIGFQAMCPVCGRQSRIMNTKCAAIDDFDNLKEDIEQVRIEQEIHKERIRHKICRKGA